MPCYAIARLKEQIQSAPTGTVRSHAGLHIHIYARSEHVCALLITARLVAVSFPSMFARPTLDLMPEAQSKVQDSPGHGL